MRRLIAEVTATLILTVAMVAPAPDFASARLPIPPGSDVVSALGEETAFVTSTIDPTDDPADVRLLVDDGGEPIVDQPSGRHAIGSSVEPPVRPTEDPVSSSHDDATLVATRILSSLSPPSPDSAGVTYISHRDNLLVSDSEVNEMTIFQNVNLYEMTRGAVLQRTGVTLPWSSEPTGVSYNPSSHHLYVSHDVGSSMVYDVDPGPDASYGSGDDTIYQLDVGSMGVGDAEGLTFDPVTGHIFVTDGGATTIHEIDPGPDGLFNGTGDTLVNSFDVAQYGAGDPEGIGVNPFSNSLLVVDNISEMVYEVTKAGTLIRAIDVTAANGTKLAGIVLAPASNNSGGWNMYIVDRGIDNGQNPNENDGRLYEMSLDFGPAGLAPTARNDLAATQQDSATIIDVADNDTDPNGNLDPTTVVTTSAPSSGSTINNADGTITYTPDPPFYGVDSFTYEICDTTSLCDSATVTIDVNAPPTASAGADWTVIDTNDDGMNLVGFDGSGSSDADGTIVSYVWIDNGSQVGTGVSPNVTLGLGTHDLTLHVIDNDGASATDMFTVNVISPPLMPEPDGGVLIVQARYGNHVNVAGFADSTANVTIAFTDPDGGPTCGTFATQNGSGNPGCDLQPGWVTTATSNGGSTEVTIYDIAINGFDTKVDTVDLSVGDPDGEIMFGCDGSVAISYGADVDRGAGATRMVPGPRATIDFSLPGPCDGLFDDATANLVLGDEIYVTAWNADGDRTLEVREIQVPFECPMTATPFTDVPATSFAYGNIKCIYGLGLTTGTSATTFSPGNFVTREQIAAFLARLARLLGVDQPGATHPFIDVSPSSFAYDDIAILYALGVTTGTSAITFGPTEFVSRDQMASLLARLYSVLFGTPSSPVLAWTADTPFTDVESTSFAYHDVGRIYGLGITKGTSPTTYSPGDYVTREQMAAFLARLLRILNFAAT